MIMLAFMAVTWTSNLAANDGWVGDAGAVRYGEALHPGPHRGGQPAYADPRREAFRGACFTEGGPPADGGSRDGVQRTPAQERWALRVCSANTTGWGPLQRLMMDTEADVLLAQEHKLTAGDIAAASDWAMRRGWKSLWAEAVETSEGGRSGGVVVLARSHLGLAPPPWGDHIVSKARAVAATMEAPGCRPTVLVSAYLIDGVGPGAANRKILADIGRRLHSLGHAAGEDHGKHLGPMPCIVAGDFNMVPEQLAETGFADSVNATIVAPRTARGTCRAANSGRVLDYFLVTNGLDQGIAKVTAGDNRIVKNHVPVMLTFKPRLTTLRALALRTPPKLPVERVFGPLPPPPDWRAARAATGRAREDAKRRPPEEAQRSLDDAYAAWANLAEEELRGVTGGQLPKKGCRAEGPKLVWRTIVPERTHRGRRSKAADEWRSTNAKVRDMMIIASAARKGQWEQASAKANELWREETGGFPSTADAERRGGARLGADGADGVRATRASVRRMSDALRDVLRRRPAEGRGEWDDWDRLAADVTVKVKEQLQRAERDERCETTEAWKEWIAEGAASGAMHAHKAVKLPQQWVPTTVTHEVTGALTADPLQILASQRREYAAQWAARDNGQKRWYSETRQSLPRLSPAEVRAASKSVKRETAQTHDGFHPRHLSLLSDAALEALSDVYEAAEALGSWPNQLNLITMPALPKPDGGYRLIGIFTAAYRVWARARRPLADQWESAHDRPYFAAGAHRSPVDAVWRQSLRAEAAMSEEGWTAAAVLTDLDKFYEHIEHQDLLDRAARLGFPEPLARLALAAYGGPRMIRLRDFVAEEVYADRGVVAGCSLATTLTKVYTLEAYDQFVEECPDAQFDNYIDDNVISAEGGKDRVVEVLTRATNLLNELVTGSLHCKISRRKTRVVAAHEDVGARLKQMTDRAVGGVLAPSAPNLGTDYAAGKCRRRHGRARKAAARLKQGLRRRARLRRVAAAIGGNGLKLFTTGTMASMTYGAEVHGISDAEWRKIDRLAAVTLRPKARGRSLNTLMALHKAPTWRAGAAPILQYVRAVWRASAAATGRRTSDLTLPELRRAWEAVDKAALRTESPHGNGRRRWDRVRGPMGANLLSLDRIAWRMTDPFTLVDDIGVERKILDHSPAMWGDIIREAVTRKYERQAAAVLARRDGSFQGRRICLDHLRPLLIPPNGKKGKARTDPLGYGIARALVCNAIWTLGRANDIDGSIADLCPLCGKGRDTIHHRLWWCEACEDLRSQMVPERLVARARREGEEKKYFTTGIIPHPAEDRPGPASAPLLTVVRYDGGPTEGTLDFQGHFFVDGSCTTHEIPELRRAGWAVVVTTPEGELVATIRSPLWHDLPQSPQAAEFVAYAAAVQYMAGPSTVFGDCANVIRQATASPRARIAPTRKYSGVMRDMLKYPHRLAHQESFVKVRAHVDIHSIQEEEGRRLAMGNDLADRLAKEAVKDHPAPSPAEEAMLAVDLADAKAIVKYAAAALRRWPALDKKIGGTRMPGGRKRQARKQEDRHDWAFVEGAWRCSRCLKCAFGSADHPGDSRGKCTGIGTDARAEEAKERGHSVAILESDGLPIICCMKCGAWTARRRRGTAKPCTGRPTKAGAQALYNIHRGKHPWLPPRARDYQRASLGGCRGKRRREGGRGHCSEELAQRRAMLSSGSGADLADTTMQVLADAAGDPAPMEHERGTNQPQEGGPKRRRVIEHVNGEGAAEAADVDQGHRGAHGHAREEALGGDLLERHRGLHRRDEPGHVDGSDDGRADKRPRLDGTQGRPSSPGRGLHQHGGVAEGGSEPVGVSRASFDPMTAEGTKGSVSDPAAGRAGPWGDDDARALLPRTAPGALPRRQRRQLVGHAGMAIDSADAANAEGAAGTAASSSGHGRAADLNREEHGGAAHDAGERVSAKRKVILDAGNADRRSEAKRRLTDLRDRVAARQRQGCTAASSGGTPEREDPIRGRANSPGARSAVVEGSTALNIGEDGERRVPMLSGAAGSVGIRGRDLSPGRGQPLTREQLLRRLRAGGGHSRAPTEPAAEANSGVALATALVATTPAPAGGSAVAVRPAGAGQQPPPPAVVRQPPDRAALLRWLSGGGG